MPKINITLMHSAVYKKRHPFQFVLVVTKHSKYKILAPTENLMALQIKKWPHIFSTSGAIVPTSSVTFRGTTYPVCTVWLIFKLKRKGNNYIKGVMERSSFPSKPRLQ